MGLSVNQLTDYRWRNMSYLSSDSPFLMSWAVLGSGSGSSGSALQMVRILRPPAEVCGYRG